MGFSPDQILKETQLLQTTQSPRPAQSAHSSHLAFVFPGQGSQKLGMLSEWGDNPVVRKIYDEASEVLGYNVWELAQIGPETQLNQTEFTQPALLTAGVALFRLWQANRTEVPALLAGHSLGEYTALVCASAMSLADGLRLVAERGRLMQEAVPPGVGAMAAILGLADAQVIELCETVNNEIENERKNNINNTINTNDSNNMNNTNTTLRDREGVLERVEPANFNAPQQVVIAGQTAAVSRAMEYAKAMGAKRAIPLAVSVPSHCSLMKPASLGLARALESISLSLPKIPVLHNVDVAVHVSVEGIRQALVSQLYSPVRWSESILRMEKEGIKTVLECGPGTVLTGLNKRITATLNSVSVNEKLNENAVVFA